MDFTDAAEKVAGEIEKRIDQRTKQLDKKIAKNQAKLATAKNERQTARFERRIQRAENSKSELAQVKSEIGTLRSSTQLYNVTISDKFNSNDAERGATAYNKSTGAVDIILPGTDIGLAAHEFHHGFEFDQGQLSISVHDGNLNIQGIRGWLSYDQSDETSAYRVQGLFGSTQTTLPLEYTSRIAGGVPFPAGPINNSSVPDIQAASNSQSPHARLQAVANRYNMAFRINNTTYGPQ
jgi:hypothetical protein